MQLLLARPEPASRPPRAVPLGWFARRFSGPRGEFFAAFRMFQEVRPLHMSTGTQCAQGFDELFASIQLHLPARRSCEVPFREIVAAVMYSLMHGSTLRELEDLFGISAAYLTRMQTPVLRAIVDGLSGIDSARMGMPATPEQRAAEAQLWRAGTGPGDRRFEWLDRCVGAMDHMLVPCVVREAGKSFDAERWRHERGFTCTNVLVVVRHDRTFAQAWIGAEGSVPDALIVEWSQAQQSIPDGHYCLYASPSLLSPKLLTPYHDARIHLGEFTDVPPRTPRELFNYCHALQRSSCVDLAVGLLKGRFACLRVGMLGNTETLVLRVRACMLLHNFIQRLYGDHDPIVAVAARARDELKDAREVGELLSTSQRRTRAPGPHASAADQTWRDALAEHCVHACHGRLPHYAADVDFPSISAAMQLNEYRVRPAYSGKAAEMQRSAKHKPAQ